MSRIGPSFLDDSCPKIAVSTAMTIKTTRMDAVAHVDRVERRSAIATMGPSSPQVPYDRMESPSRVPSSFRSLRMGINAPMAVVVRAMVTARPSSPRAETPVKQYTAPNANARVIIQVTRPLFPSRPVIVRGFIS